LKFKVFGWNGLSFEIPEEMHLVSEGGSATAGYMRLEAKDHFFEIRWEEVQPKKAKPLAEVVDAFIKKMEKDSKKKKQEIVFRGRKSTEVFKHKALSLEEKSNVSGYIYFWYCKESSRVIMFRFAFISLDEKARSIIKQTLSSLKCHGEESNLWTVFGSSFRAPSTFQLTERKMLVGRVYLVLHERKISLITEKHREILFEYFTTANVQFEKDYKDMDKWLENNYLKDLKKRYRGIKFQPSTKTEINNHPASVRMGTGKSGLTMRKSSLYMNISWYCEDLNRIYSVTISEHLAKPLPLKREIDEKTFEAFAKEVISSVRCH